MHYFNKKIALLSHFLVTCIVTEMQKCTMGAQRYFCLCAQPVPMRLEARSGRNEGHHGFPRLTLPFPSNRRTFMA